jgi:hypothetical protein
MSIRSSERGIGNMRCWCDRIDFSPSSQRKLGCPEGYHQPHDREMGDFRVVAPVSCVIPKKTSLVMIQEVGDFCSVCTDLGPWVHLGHFERVCLLLLGLAPGRRTVLWMFFLCTFFVHQRLVPQDHWMGNGECAMLEQQE